MLKVKFFKDVTNYFLDLDLSNSNLKEIIKLNNSPFAQAVYNYNTNNQSTQDLDKFENQDQKLTNKRFDLLDNTKEGLIKQEQFFKFLKKQGYNGLDFTKFSDSQYVITFSNLEITPQQKQQALQLYSQYLDTIFPENKIEYRGDSFNLEKFKYSESLTLADDGVTVVNKNKLGSGVYTTPNLKFSEDFAKDNNGKLYSVLVNTQNELKFNSRLDFLKAVSFY